MPLITQEKPKMMVGGKRGGEGGGDMFAGKFGVRPRDCVPVAWQDGEVFFSMFFLCFSPLIRCLTCAFIHVGDDFFFIFF